jgi:RNA polymerase sigma factor (sigma-70 family)
LETLKVGQDDLIAMCKRGDPVAYTGLYEQHSAAVYSTILRLVAHTGEAEDILQESFVVAFQKINDFKNTGGFRAWVKRIAINKSVDVMRRRKIKYVELETGQMREEDDEMVDEDAFEYKMDTVMAAVAALPEGYRTVFNLYAVENIPHTEIARMLGLEHNAVRTQYHRAKHKVLNMLKQGGYSER